MLPAAARVTHGSIHLEGAELIGFSPKKREQIRREQLSLVLQNPMTAFNPLMTIGKQFTETLRLQGRYSKKQAYLRAIQCLEEMNMLDPEQVLSQYPFELSGGMLQRIIGAW